MNGTVRGILVKEEQIGAYATNLFRYGIAVLFLFLAFGTAKSPSDLFLNFLTLSLFLAFTILHTVLLIRKSKYLNIVFDYFTVIFDYSLIFGTPVIYSLRVSPDNFAHVLKNPILFLLMLPIALTALQFRIRLVLFSILLFVVFWFGLVSAGLYLGIPLTQDWKDYVLGPGVILSDLILRPLPFIILGLILTFITYRAVSMIRRIGDLESRRASLARFFSPDVVEQLSSAEAGFESGVRQKVSILFSDIREFTQLSEDLDPSVLAQFLTDYRNRMTNAIFEFGGTLDKFIGDAIMATFGTPKPSEIQGQDASNAIKAGQKMFLVLEEINSERKKRGLLPVEIGIGIHVGEVFCGTIGTEGRMEYTVIGDAVNTASRIESLCKLFKERFLISDAVLKEVGSGLLVKKLPLTKVKGKSLPLQVYSLSGPKPVSRKN